MKAVVALILLTSSYNLIPKAVEKFKIETFTKVDGGISPLSSFTTRG